MILNSVMNKQGYIHTVRYYSQHDNSHTILSEIRPKQNNKYCLILFLRNAKTAKLIYSDRYQDSGYVQGELVTRVGDERHFWGANKVLLIEHAKGVFTVQKSLSCTLRVCILSHISYINKKYMSLQKIWIMWKVKTKKKKTPKHSLISPQNLKA